MFWLTLGQALRGRPLPGALPDGPLPALAAFVAGAALLALVLWAAASLAYGLRRRA
jgi:hypothetical protein